MATRAPDPAELHALQEQILRENILRARAMTPEQRFAEGLELSNTVHQLMFAGALWQTNQRDAEKGWKEVERRMEIVHRIADRGLFVNERPQDR